jgi:hypothetical protein
LTRLTEGRPPAVSSLTVSPPEQAIDATGGVLPHFWVLLRGFWRDLGCFCVICAIFDAKPCSCHLVSISAVCVAYSVGGDSA